MNTQVREALRTGQQAGARYALSLLDTAPAGVAGTRLARAQGASLEFRDFRDYQPGDDLRRIDWNAFARSDRLTVRIYQEEISPHVDIVLDGSRSMALPLSRKAEAAAGLTALLATAALNSSCTFRTWLAGAGVRELGQACQNPGHWPDFEFDFAGSVSDSFVMLPPPWRPHGIRILISDLLWSGDPTGTLRHLAAGAATLVVVQLLGRADSEPPAHGNVTVVDVETGERRELFVDAVMRQSYIEGLNRHKQSWREACRRSGARLVSVEAEEVITTWDMRSLLADRILEIV